VIRILVVDDHAGVRSGLRALLSTCSDFEVVGEAEDGLRGVALACERRPDLVLMDLSMPLVDGAHATRRLLAADRRTRVLVLTAGFSDRASVPDAIDAGAVGSVVKDAEPTEIFGAIRAAAAGRRAGGDGRAHARPRGGRPRARHRFARPALRASDADRDRAVAALRRHFVDGRLSVDELSERVEHGYAASTLSELEALLADLPGE
jgi:DNA-binding NarL/FixJ family response regulator